MSLSPNEKSIGRNMIEDIKTRMYIDRSSARSLSLDLLWSYLTDGADIVADGSRARTRMWEINLIAGHQNYPFPEDCLSLDSILMCWPTGLTFPAYRETYATMEMIYPFWRTDDPSKIIKGMPDRIICENFEYGGGDFYVFPTPHYSYPRGIRIMGARNASDWMMDSPCPFNHNSALESIIYYAMFKLAMDFDIFEPNSGWMNRAKLYRSESIKYLGKFKKHIHSLRSNQNMPSFGGGI